MGAAYSGDQTVAYTKTIDPNTRHTVEFALIPFRMFDSPNSEAFMSLYNVYNPLFDPLALHFMNHTQRSDAAEAARPQATPLSEAALSVHTKRTKVLRFYRADAARSTPEEYFRQNVQAPRNVPPTLNTTYPCAIAVREHRHSERRSTRPGGADDDDDGHPDEGDEKDQWRFCGYIGIRTFNVSGASGTTGYIGTFLDSASRDRRGWSLLVFRLACRLFKDSSLRRFGDVTWPMHMSWSVLANNYFCLSAQVRCAKFIADQEDAILNDPNRAYSKGYSDDDGPPGEHLYCDGSWWRHPTKTRRFADGDGSRHAAPVDVPPPVQTSPGAIDGVLPLMHDIQAVKLTTREVIIDERRVPSLTFSTEHRDDVLQRCGEVLARSIDEMTVRASGLPAGLGALLPLWNPENDVCLEAVGVKIPAADEGQPREGEGPLLLEFRRLYRKSRTRGNDTAESSTVTGGTGPAARVHVMEQETESVAPPSTTGMHAWV